MSGVLQAMGVDEPTGFGTLRLSVGRYATALLSSIGWFEKFRRFSAAIWR